MGWDDSCLFLPGFRFLGYQMQVKAVRAALAFQELSACVVRSVLSGLELQDETKHEPG